MNLKNDDQEKETDRISESESLKSILKTPTSSRESSESGSTYQVTKKVRFNIADRTTNKYKCTDCKRCFESYREVSYHKKLVHTRGKVLNFHRHCELTHVKRRTPRVQQYKLCYSCVICKRTFQSLSIIQEHMRGTHKLSVCIICSKRFTSKCNLNKHILLHLQKGQSEVMNGSVRQVLAPCNGQVMNLESGKIMNHETHPVLSKPDRPVLKAANQEWDSITIKKIRRRKRSANEVRLPLLDSSGAVVRAGYMCGECDLKYEALAELKLHVAQFHTKPCFSCTLCKMEFSIAVSLARHMRVHRKRVLYRCATCDREYKNKVCLTKHEGSHRSDSVAITTAVHSLQKLAKLYNN